MKKKDIIQLVKESVEEMRAFYGSHDNFQPTGQRRNLSGMPGVMEDKKPNLKSIADVDRSSWTPDGGGGSIGYMEWEDGTEMTPQEIQDYFEINHELYDDIMQGLYENKENLKEFTDYGQEGIYPKKEKPGDMFRQKEVEDLFPHGMASRSDKAFQDRLKKHADWTEQSAYNNTFVHMQYHETKGLEDEYFIYQTQHYNSNYDDFRNPKFTMLSITKNKGTEKEEDLGQYIVDTNAYIRDLNKFDEQGNLGKRVMESPMFRTGVKMDMAPKVMAPRLKKVFDKVNGAKHPVRTPEWHKNRFKDKYGISFPETLKGINKDQALAMNKYANDMEIKEADLYTVTSTDGEEKQVSFPDQATAQKAVAKNANIKAAVKLEENLLNRIKQIQDFEKTEDDLYYGPKGKGYFVQKYMDDDGGAPRYVVFKDRGLDVDPDPEPDFQSTNPNKIKDFLLSKTKNEGNAFAVARLKAIKAGDKKFKLGDKEFDVTDVSDDDKKAAAELDETMHTNDVGKDDYVDDEGRYAKSQLYKMGKYAMKLHDMLDDMEQLPAWLQSKLTKASDYMSMVYHYLDYEFARRGDNLMEHVDKYKRRTKLMEGATEKLFKLFNAGKTDSEVRAHYLQMQIDMPETFVSKLRKNWEDLKKTKLDLQLADKEAEDFEKIQSEPKQVTGMENDGMEEEKQLASKLFTK